MDLPDGVRRKAFALGDTGQRWIDGLDHVVAELAADWELSIGETLGGGSGGYVADAITADGYERGLEGRHPRRSGGPQSVRSGAADAVARGRTRRRTRAAFGSGPPGHAARASWATAECARASGRDADRHHRGDGPARMRIARRVAVGVRVVANRRRAGSVPERLHSRRGGTRLRNRARHKPCDGPSSTRRRGGRRSIPRPRC